MSDGVDARNRASADSLTALGERLSDDELRTEIDPPWTAAGLFAHIAFWDRFVQERWRLAAERGERTPMAVDGGLMDRVNDASLRQWMSIPPRAAVEECATSASDVDVFVEDARMTSERSSPQRVGNGSSIARSIAATTWGPSRRPSPRIESGQSRSTSRWLTETRCPCSRNQSARSSATTTERCRPPVQPIAIVRYDFPSST